MELTIDNKPAGRVDIGLFGKNCPKNVNNILHFIAKTNKNNSEIKQTYEGTNFFKIVPKFLIQGGDISCNDGTGHLSVYNNEFVEDEISKNITFCEAGLLALANKGENTNGSQFFFTLDENPKIDGKYTIIGRVLKGYESLQKISFKCGSIQGDPLCDVKVAKTGIYSYEEYLKQKRSFYI